MRMVDLGRSGIRVSALGLGGAQFSKITKSQTATGGADGNPRSLPSNHRRAAPQAYGQTLNMPELPFPRSRVYRPQALRKE